MQTQPGVLNCQPLPTTSRARLLFLALVSSICLADFASAQIDPPIPRVETKRRIVYATHGGVELKLDLAFPKRGKMRPAVMCIHGGGWRAGNRESYHKRIAEIAEQGYVAATVSYRFSDVAPWPAQFGDVKAAYRWLVDHAEEYGIDPERIAVRGDSAGGHLSMMLGSAFSETGESTIGTRPRAVINYYGPSDLRSADRIERARGLVEALAGGTFEEKADVLASASPITFVDRCDSPVITFHGTEDKLVPILHGTTMHAALSKAKVPNQLFRMEGAAHGIGGDIEAGRKALAAFTDAYLKPTYLPLLAHEDFDSGADRWSTTDASAWELQNKSGRSYFALTKKRSEYEPPVRSPYNQALLKNVEVGSFVLDVDFRSSNEVYGHQDLCLFFGHQDASHFYYVHFGRKADAHANSIFLVNGEPRVSIAKERTDGTDWSRGWHRARIKRDVRSGSIEVYFDDMQKPIMKTVDKTFVRGTVGIGSFDDTGHFDAIRLWGVQEAMFRQHTPRRIGGRPDCSGF